jgi:16S rRNA (cytidine1402-2'-O)-methyltransferase
VIVRTVLEADFRVIPIPGASSALAAVSAAGLRAGGFRFIGFLPAGARERERVLRNIASSDEAAVLFEAPHRIHALQGELSHILPPDRRVVIARELTKKFETIRVHTASALADLEPEERGEYVIVIDAAEHADRAALDPQGQRWLDALLDEMTPARAAAIVSRMTGVPRSVVYDEAIGRRRKPLKD